MKILSVSAIILALAGAGPAHAQDGKQAAMTEHQNAAQQVRWRDFDNRQSTLLSQLNAVYRILRSELADELGQVAVDTVQARVEDGTEGSPTGDCRFMPIPGSRIRAERCYYPSEGELALNQYQFQEEIRFIRQQQEIMAMEAAMRQAEEEQARQAREAMSARFR